MKPSTFLASLCLLLLASVSPLRFKGQIQTLTITDSKTNSTSLVGASNMEKNAHSQQAKQQTKVLSELKSKEKDSEKLYVPIQPKEEILMEDYVQLEDQEFEDQFDPLFLEEGENDGYYLTQEEGLWMAVGDPIYGRNTALSELAEGAELEEELVLGEASQNAQIKLKSEMKNEQSQKEDIKLRAKNRV